MQVVEVGGRQGDLQPECVHDMQPTAGLDFLAGVNQPGWRQIKRRCSIRWFTSTMLQCVRVVVMWLDIVVMDRYCSCSTRATRAPNSHRVNSSAMSRRRL